MNSDIELLCSGEGAGRRLERAARWLVAYEDRYSRFRPFSELSRLNAASGQPTRVSPGLLQLIELSLQFARRSGGLFDPTVLGDLEFAGYDRSFELIQPAGAPPSRQRAGDAWRDVAVDHANRCVTLPAGAGFDPGGIGKGWAVDRLAALLGTPCLVNGGGDVFAGGTPPGEEHWRVGIADPFRPDRDIAVVRLSSRGVATSSTLKRSWRRLEKNGDSIVLHHLIDPRTGLPSTTDAVQVSALTSSATLADYHAKVALLLGVNDGLAYLDGEPDVEGLIVDRDGSVRQSRGLADFL